MFARFDENPAMTLQDIKETKRYRRKDGQRENSIPTTNKVCGGINMVINLNYTCIFDSACWVIFMLFCPLQTFSKLNFSINSFRNTSKVSNDLDPDQD